MDRPVLIARTLVGSTSKPVCKEPKECSCTDRQGCSPKQPEFAECHLFESMVSIWQERMLMGIGSSKQFVDCHINPNSIPVLNPQPTIPTTSEFEPSSFDMKWLSKFSTQFLTLGGGRKVAASWYMSSWRTSFRSSILSAAQSNGWNMPMHYLARIAFLQLIVVLEVGMAETVGNAYALVRVES